MVNRFSIRTRYATILFVLGSATSAWGQVEGDGNRWMGAGSDNLWSNADNWHLGVAPLGASQHPYFGWDDLNGPFYPLTPNTSDDGPLGNNDVKLWAEGATVLIDSSVQATAYGVRMGYGGATNTLEITGGTLDVGGIPNGQTDPVGWHLDVGRGYPGFDGRPVLPNPQATLLMSGGTVNTQGFLIPEQFVDSSQADPYDTAPLNGVVLMSGGTINARWMNLGQLTGNGRAELSGDAVINLAPNIPSQPANGGHLSFNRDWFINGNPITSIGEVSLDIRDNAIINIRGHVSDLINAPNQSEVDRYQGYVNDGTLTADDGSDVPTIYLDDSMIKICALDADFDGDCDTDTDDLATWQANYGMTGLAGELKAIGDADNDGDVDGADFLELQIEFGVGVDPDPLGTVTNIPEPAAIHLLLIGSLATTLKRYRTTQRIHTYIISGTEI